MKKLSLLIVSLILMGCASTQPSQASADQIARIKQAGFQSKQSTFQQQTQQQLEAQRQASEYDVETERLKKELVEKGYQEEAAQFYASIRKNPEDVGNIKYKDAPVGFITMARDRDMYVDELIAYLINKSPDYIARYRGDYTLYGLFREHSEFEIGGMVISERLGEPFHVLNERTALYRKNNHVYKVKFKDGIKKNRVVDLMGQKSESYTTVTGARQYTYTFIEI